MELTIKSEAPVVTAGAGLCDTVVRYVTKMIVHSQDLSHLLRAKINVTDRVGGVSSRTWDDTYAVDPCKT